MRPTEKQILATARERYKNCLEAWSEMRNTHREVVKFISGDQWSSSVRAKFENQGYAAITSNRIPTFLRQITNEIRKNTPEININPRESSDSSIEKAELLNDLIRNIQDESSADNAYCIAAENAASVGIGYIRVLTQYSDNDSMDQEICIDPIIDNELVMIDPNFRSIDGSDMEYAFISTSLPIEEYTRKYHRSKYAKLVRGEDTDVQPRDIGWSSGDTRSRRFKIDKENVVVMEYYFKDYDQKTLCQFRNVFTGEITTAFKGDVDYSTDEYEELQSRKVSVPIIRWCKLNDVEVLEDTTFPGEFIPIAIVKGNEYWTESRRKIVGAVEPAIETQMQLNYALSFRSQLLQMAPKAPYIGTADQFKNYEQQWADINVSNQAFLPYNPDAGAPPPSRDLGELPINTANAMIAQAERDLNAIFGVFDPSNQTVAPESGKAILARQAQAYNSNFHFYDNLSKAIQHVGRIIVEAIPVIYDTARNIQVKSEDGKKKTVAINQPNEKGVVEYDLSAGKYTVSIQTGASFGTKRQETVDSIMSLIQVYPTAATAIADIAVRNMDWPGASRIADSLEALVPPNVMQARKVDPKNAAALIPQLQSQVAQLTQQNQALTQQVQQSTVKIQESNDKLHIEQLKADIDIQKIDQDRAIKAAQLQLDAQRLAMEYQVKLHEIRIAEQQLKLKQSEFGMDATLAMSGIADKMHDRATTVINSPEADDISSNITEITGLDAGLV